MGDFFHWWNHDFFEFAVQLAVSNCHGFDKNVGRVVAIDLQFIDRAFSFQMNHFGLWTQPVLRPHKQQHCAVHLVCVDL